MRATWEHLALRVLWYGGVLVGLPSAVVGIWVLAPQLGVTLDPLAYLIVSQIVVALIILVLTARTVTNRLPNQRETELLTAVQTYQKFFTLYEHSPVPYLILDKKGRVRLYNLAAVRMFATDTEALRGQVFTSYLQHEDTNFLTTIKRNIADRTVIKDKEVQLVATNGAVRWVLLSVFVDDISTEQLVSLVDITRQKELDAIKSEFVALATHQLRTPIAAIRWNAELLQKRLAASADASLGSYAEKIERNSVRMNSLINDFLNVSKLEMGTFATEPTPIDLAEFCQSILEEFEEKIQSKSLHVSTQYQPDSARAEIDGRLLHIVISNLVSNAVKYTPAEAGVSLQYVVQNGHIIFSVIDTGIGIPVQEQENLFSKFYRASNAKQHQTEGTGLGLYVVAKAVKKLSGRLTYTSEEGKGTQFTVTIPYHAA